MLRGAFPKTSPAPSSIDPMASQQSYAVSGEGSGAIRFRLIRRDGSVYSISYAMLPVFILEENSRLLIKTHALQAVITGRGLDHLETDFTNEKMSWVRESFSGKDDGQGSVFIEAIEIEMLDEL